MVSSGKTGSVNAEPAPLLGPEADLPLSDSKRSRINENFRLLSGDIREEREVFRSSPLLVEFSVNNRCNLRCVMCDSREQPGHVLPDALVKDVLVDMLLPRAAALMPSSGSEPFLGDLDLLGQACMEHEVQLNLITNGTLITREKLEVIAPVTGRLQISVDGHHAQLYESIRVGARFDRVVRNIGIAAEVAHREGYELMLSCVYSTGLAREMADYVRFAAGLGADAVVFQRIHHSTPMAARIDAFQALGEDEIAAEMDAAVEAAEEAGIDIHLDFHPPVTRAFNRRPRRLFLRTVVEQTLKDRFPDMCFMAASYVGVFPGGSVLPCCAGGTDLVMGDLTRESPEAIWNGSRYQALRRSFYTGEYLEPCRNCPHRHRGRWSEEAQS